MNNKFYQINRKSFEDEGVKSEQELWDKVKGEYKGFACEFPVTFEKTIVKKEDKDEEVMTMTISTDDEDRHGDIVMQDWDLKWYKKNPVLLDSHNYDSITHIIGRMNNVRTEGKKTKAEPEFAEMNPKGVLAKQMAQAGFLNTSSVGFIPKEFDKDGKILKSELLEVSMVSVPANARALFEKVAEETKEEIETLKTEIEETPEEEAVEKIIETKVVIDKKKVVLNSIARALQEMNKANMANKREKIFKALRSL
jgi:hypothetical protein